MSVRHNRSIRLRPVAFVAALVGASAALAGGGRAWAHSYGAPSTIFRESRPPSCNGCHRGGVAPVVTVSASAARIVPAASVVLTVTVTTPNGSPGTAGFDLRSSRPGRFSIGGPDPAATMIVRGRNGWSEATHRTPKAGEPAVFTVLWAPEPGVTGTVTFTAWGNAVDGNVANDGPRGDRAARATADVVVGRARGRSDSEP